MAVFLGNPGKEYERTRHNMAVMLLNTLLSSTTVHWKQKFHGRVGEWVSGTERCRILQPETFMNLSGKSVSAALVFHKVDVRQLLVVHDDLELPFGQFAWREAGGLGGHNGLKSIKESLGTADFMRFRLGIGRPTRGSVKSWVLGRFTPDEETVLPLILDKASDELADILRGKTQISGRPEPITVLR